MENKHQEAGSPRAGSFCSAVERGSPSYMVCPPALSAEEALTQGHSKRLTKQGQPLVICLGMIGTLAL